MFSAEQTAQLSAKLHPEAVKQRSQSGRNLAYIEGWWAIAEANRIFGFDKWSRETFDIKCVTDAERMLGKEPNQRKGWGVSYIAQCRVTIGTITREGVGSGHGIDADRGQAHESAIKEAETDAMKRALMTFGNPFGLALYDKQRENVGIDEVPEPAAPSDDARERIKKLAAALQHCPSVQAVDELMAKHADTITHMPVTWRVKWNHQVSEMKQRLSTVRAA
jgi:DNA recombination protein Rad52